MLLNSNALISMREANQNFSKVTRMVEEKGHAVIMKNNKPSFIVIPFEKETMQNEEFETLSDELVMQIIQKFADKYDQALRELAK